MWVGWEKRYNKFYAYAKDSKFIDGKTRTKNIYLGMDWKTVRSKLDEKFKDDAELAKNIYNQLQAYANRKGYAIIDDNELPKREHEQELFDLLEGLHVLINELPTAKSLLTRAALHRKLTQQYELLKDKVLGGESIG